MAKRGRPITIFEPIVTKKEQSATEYRTMVARIRAAELLIARNLCPECGELLLRITHPTAARESHCLKCGFRLTAAPPLPKVDDRAPFFRRYTRKIGGMQMFEGANIRRAA